MYSHGIYFREVAREKCQTSIVLELWYFKDSLKMSFFPLKFFSWIPRTNRSGAKWSEVFNKHSAWIWSGHSQAAVCFWEGMGKCLINYEGQSSWEGSGVCCWWWWEGWERTLIVVRADEFHRSHCYSCLCWRACHVISFGDFCVCKAVNKKGILEWKLLGTCPWNCRCLVGLGQSERQRGNEPNVV